MNDLPDILDWNEFEQPDYQAWMDRVSKELKGTSIQSLNLDIGDQTLNPFILKREAQANVHIRQLDHWQAGVCIRVESAAQANRDILGWLQAGASYLHLHVSAGFSDWGILFDKVQLDWIHTRVDASEDSCVSLQRWLSKGKSECADQVFYGKSIVAFEQSIPSIQSFVATVSHWQEKNMLVNFPLGNAFFENIAYARALRLIWQEKKPSNAEALYIHASIDASVLIPDNNTNAIISTTQALAAVLGVVDFLVLEPYHTQDKDFYKRIFLNIQHILTMESHVGQVHDPMAGSYIVEEMTNILVSRAYEENINSQ